MVGAPPIATRPAELVREAAMPYRSVFDVVWSGRRHIMMMASQIDRYGQPEHLGHRAARPAQGAARRRARRAGQLGQPPHQLLGARPQRAHLRRAGRRGVRRRLRPGRRGRRRRHALPRRPPRRLQPRRVRLRDARPHHAPALVPPRRHASTTSWPPPGSRSTIPRRRRPRPASPRPRSSTSSACARPRLAARPRGAELSGRRARRRGRSGSLHPALHTELCDRVGVRCPPRADRHGLGRRPAARRRHLRGGRARHPGLGHHDARRAGPGHRRGAQPDRGALRRQPAHRRGRRARAHRAR